MDSAVGGVEVRGDNHVDVLGPSDDAPGIEGEASNHDELDIRLC